MKTAYVVTGLVLTLAAVLSTGRVPITAPENSVFSESCQHEVNCNGR